MAKNTSGLRRGGPGRPKGVPNKATLEVREACAKLVDDEEYQRRLIQRLRSGRLSPAVETMLWHYAKGKPAEHVELTGANGNPLEIKEIRESIAGKLAGLAARIGAIGVAGQPH